MAETSFTISFQAPDIETDEDGEVTKSITAEVVAEDNNDKTTFNFGDKAIFRVYTTPSELEYECYPSDGVIYPKIGRGIGSSELVETQVQFANSNEASASKPIAGEGVSGVWLGNNLGALSKKSRNTVTCSKTGVGVANVSYVTEFQRHSVTVGVRDESPYPVLIYIKSTGEEC